MSIGMTDRDLLISPASSGHCTRDVLIVIEDVPRWYRDVEHQRHQIELRHQAFLTCLTNGAAGLQLQQNTNLPTTNWTAFGTVPTVTNPVYPKSSQPASKLGFEEYHWPLYPEGRTPRVRIVRVPDIQISQNSFLRPCATARSQPIEQLRLQLHLSLTTALRSQGLRCDDFVESRVVCRNIVDGLNAAVAED